MEYTYTTRSHPPAVLDPDMPKSNTKHNNNHPVFADAMTVRYTVFVDEQHCSPEAENDDDDARSWQFVIYARPLSEKKEEEEEKEKPVAVVRLVPPPHAPHETLLNPAATDLPQWDVQHEAYVKITRVAVLKPFRGRGLAARLMREVEEWAAANRDRVDELSRLVDAQTKPWRGLVGLHAQVPVEQMYARLGYETDPSLGVWDEEGMQHVGMFKRLAVAA